MKTCDMEFCSATVYTTLERQEPPFVAPDTLYRTYNVTALVLCACLF